MLSIQMAGAVMTAWWIRDTRKHFRVEHDDNEFAGRRSRVNGLSKALGPSPKRGLVSVASTGKGFLVPRGDHDFVLSAPAAQ